MKEAASFPPARRMFGFFETKRRSLASSFQLRDGDKEGTDPTEAAAASDVETTRCRPTQSPARARFPAQVLFRKMRIIFLYRLRP